MGSDAGKTTFSISVPGSQLELTDGGSPEETIGPKEENKVKDSGTEDPTKYNLDSKKKPNSKNAPKPILYASSPVPPQHPAITSQRADNLGYRDTGSLWRKVALSLPYGEKAKFKAEQIREFQYNSYYIPDAKNPANTKEVAAVEELRKQVLASPIESKHIQEAIDIIEHAKSITEIRVELDKVNPNLLGYIGKAMYAQFSRGAGGSQSALLSLDDLSVYTGQWLDKRGNFEIREMVDILKAAQFYNLKELVVDRNSTILYSQKINNKGIVVNDVALTKSTYDPKNGQVNYSLESNSIEAVVALADQIANNRQGSTNFIKLDTMGDDVILFLVLARTLISQHGMQIGIDPRLKQQVDAELKSLNNPELIKEWDDIYSKKMAHHYYDVRRNRPHNQWQQPEKVTRLMEIIEKNNPPQPAPPVGGVTVTATPNPNAGVVVKAAAKPSLHSP